MIVTSFSNEGYKKYGKRCIETFLKHWKDENLVVYYERTLPDDAPKDDRVTYYDLFAFTKLREFLKIIQRSDPLFRGQCFDAKSQQQMYSFRYDVDRFSRKAFCIAHAGDQLAKGKLFAWLDADTYFFKDVPENFLQSIITDNDTMIAHLNREWSYTETGFVVFNPLAPEFNLFISLYIDTYLNGSFRYLTEWHDCYVLDFVMRQIDVKAVNLTRDENSNHPFNESIIGQYCDHMKGPERKDAGQSKPHELPQKAIMG